MALIGRPLNDCCKVMSVKGSRIKAIKDHKITAHKIPNWALEILIFKSPIDGTDYLRRLDFVNFVDIQIRINKCKTVE